MKIKVFLPTVIIFFSASIFISCKKDKGNEDSTPPVITLKGDNPYTAGMGTLYTDPGYTAYDETDGDITSQVVLNNNVNMSDTGTYLVKYNVSDKAGNAAKEAIRTVKVIIF